MDLDTAVRELAAPLLRYCLGRTGDPALAEEAAQEALAALVARWRRHGPPVEPGPAATGRVVRAALDGEERAEGSLVRTPRAHSLPAGTPEAEGPQADTTSRTPGTVGPRSRATRLRRPLLPSAAGALAAALLLAVGLWLSFGRFPPGPGEEPAAVSITNVGGIVVVRAGGRTRLVRTHGSPAAGSPEPAGELFIRYGGGE